MAFSGELNQWLESADKSVTLSALLLADPTYFPLSGQLSRQLTVDLTRIRKLRSGALTSMPADPFAVLAQNADAEFVFGRVVFPVRTGPREGQGSLALSLWKDDRPIDEIPMRFCVSSDSQRSSMCQGMGAVASGFEGTDSLRVARESSKPPDAALHFVELERSVGMGVFRHDGRYHVWKLGESIEFFHSYLRDTMLPQLGLAQYNETQLSSKGRNLYELFFPDTDADGRAARAAFEGFVKPYLAREVVPGSDPPSMFVRMWPTGPDPVPMVPVGLMAVPSGDVLKFLGMYFRIETPLPVQTYESKSACLSRWVAVVPPATTSDSTLLAARNGFARRVSGWQQQGEVYEQMAEFETWMRGPGPKASSTALIVVSHHDHNSIFFAPGDSLISSAVQPFKRPSIAVLSGCGTAGPGALNLIRRLSERGMEAIIATNVEVEGEMAGQFVECLAKAADDNRTSTDFNLSRAYFSALVCLKTKQASKQGARPYGARVLQYSLLGNGALRLCPPQKAIR
jgi:hypothetical protein